MDFPTSPKRIVFEYDPVGNLMAEVTQQENELDLRKEYVYFPESMLLQAELTRDEIGKSIRIVSYTYKFRL
jgi:hypothetical protein